MRPEWIAALAELGGILLAVVKIALMFGKALQKLEDHDRRIERIEQELDPHATWLRKPVTK